MNSCTAKILKSVQLSSALLYEQLDDSIAYQESLSNSLALRFCADNMQASQDPAPGRSLNVSKDKTSLALPGCEETMLTNVWRGPRATVQDMTSLCLAQQMAWLCSTQEH